MLKPADLVRSAHPAAVSLYQPIFYTSSSVDRTDEHRSGSTVPPASQHKNYSVSSSLEAAMALWRTDKTVSIFNDKTKNLLCRHRFGIGPFVILLLVSEERVFVRHFALSTVNF